MGCGNLVLVRQKCTGIEPSALAMFLTFHSHNVVGGVSVTTLLPSQQLDELPERLSWAC